MASHALAMKLARIKRVEDENMFENPDRLALGIEQKRLQSAYK